jgi:hypothetical protein
MSAGEAAWFATPSVSWQGIVLGDPFYQPFAVTLETQVRAASAKEALGDYALLRHFNLLPQPLGTEDLRKLQAAADRSGRLALRLACAQAEQAAGVTRPWKDPLDLSAEEGGLIAEATRFVEARFGAKTAQKLRAELEKRPAWATPARPGTEKAPGK